MELDYYVHVKALNTVEGEKEEYDFITEAYFSGDEGDYTLIYDENSKSGEISRTQIRVIGGEKIDLRRESEMCTVMTIEKGKRNISEIILPFGKITMGVMGINIASKLEENGGKLFLHYVTYTDREPLGDMRFNFSFYKKDTVATNEIF